MIAIPNIADLMTIPTPITDVCAIRQPRSLTSMTTGLAPLRDALNSHPQIQTTGQKRGTRYQWKAGN